MCVVTRLSISFTVWVGRGMSCVLQRVFGMIEFQEVLGLHRDSPGKIELLKVLRRRWRAGRQLRRCAPGQ